MGASRGIGAATAKKFVADGVYVVLASRNRESCEAVRAQSIAAFNGLSESASCDAGDYAAVEALVRDVLERCGRLDYIINNAGTMDPIGFVQDCDAGDWARGVSLNLFSAFNGSRAVLPHFTKHGGVIVNLSTGAAFHPLSGWSAYCASKAALAMFTRTLGLEVAGTDIRIYGFQPGMVNTSMTREGLKKKVNRISELDPESFTGPEAPARAIAWLCREAPQDLSGGEVDINAPEFRARAGLDS
ncbi:MAG TPA: SDR family oxidoreductase [Parvularculaceae bacterium]|nr:SDR family oxidoreductase [Parvularculaceae bacterium]